MTQVLAESEKKKKKKKRNLLLCTKNALSYDAPNGFFQTLKTTRFTVRFQTLDHVK